MILDAACDKAKTYASLIVSIALLISFVAMSIRYCAIVRKYV